MRARSSRLRMRINVSTCASAVDSEARDAAVGSIASMAQRSTPCARLLRWFNGFEQTIDHFGNRHALGFGAVVNQNSVPEYRVREFAHIADRNMGTALQQCTGFSAEHQAL